MSEKKTQIPPLKRLRTQSMEAIVELQAYLMFSDRTRVCVHAFVFAYRVHVGMKSY